MREFPQRNPIVFAMRRPVTTLILVVALISGGFLAFNKVSDGQWIEVTNLQHPADPRNDDQWVPINGLEQVILGDLFDPR